MEVDDIISYHDLVTAEKASGMLTYEGHDEPQRRGGLNPKEVDQPITTPRGSWTENGKFFRAAMDFKSGLRDEASPTIGALRTPVEKGKSVDMLERPF